MGEDIVEKKRKHKFGIKLKLVVFTTVLSIITYSVSGFFIYFVYENFRDSIPLSEELFTIITLLLGIIWSVILAYVAGGVISKPLQRLEESVNKAANGQINQDVVVNKSDDEIRSLGLAFNKMLGNLRKMVLNIEDNFRETNQKVLDITSASEDSAEQTENIRRTMVEIATGAERSATAVQSAAESVDEMTMLAEKVQDRAQGSHQLAGEMVKTLEQSKKVIQSLVDGIGELAEDNRSSLDAVRRLEDNAKEVEQIISLVGELAEQTNLLALNASIEAARAGEHGKGFAVVAEEVRKLADESAHAVNGISTLIKSIQAGVLEVVSQIEEQVNTANHEVEKGTETNKAIAEMTDSVNEVEAAVKEIAQLAQQQMDGLKNTSTQAQEVAGIAEETSAGAEEVSAGVQEQSAMVENISHISRQLSDQAEKLKLTIKQFTIDVDTAEEE